MPRVTCHVSRVPPDCGVVVRGVCDGAGLHLVAVALGRAVLALELVAALHLLCLQPTRGQVRDERTLSYPAWALP